MHVQLVRGSEFRSAVLVSDREGVQNSDVSTSKHTLLAVGRGHGFLAPPDLVRASSVSCFSVGGSLARCKLLVARGGAPVMASNSVR